MNRLLLSAAALCLGTASLAAQDDPAEKLLALPGFKVEHVLKADAKVNGSWINMTRDPQGRLLLTGQRGQVVTRLTLKDGKVEKQEELKLPISEIMGLLFAHDALYVNGSGKDSAGKGANYGLFRLKGENFETVEFLREWKGGAGEHGAHGLVLGPDGLIYTVNGNFTDIPADGLPSSPHRNYADDRILPRAEDGNGFGAGRKPPGGYVARFDKDGKNAELVGAGQRNCYDVAFNADGELFGFDSDMEWDWGSPWYRPVRVFHVVSGADHGFREGSAKWPEYYLDSNPATVNIGIGCPTGVVFGYGAKFPAKYQKALYILDWSYGRLIAVHLTPKGASYSATWENLVAPKGLTGGPKTPLNLTDVVVGADGALYFTVGGRNTGAHLFRVVYTGPDSTAAVDYHEKDGAEARAKRHAIEKLHGKEDAAALEAAKANLASPDRFIRYAARIALERQPVDSWKAAVLAETNVQGAMTGLVALARVGSTDAQPDLYKALAKFPAAKLNDADLIDKLRVIEVSVARHGKPSADVAKALVDELTPLFPAKSVVLNTELCQVLLALDAPEAVAKTVGLLNSSATQEEQIGYLMFLRTITANWTPELRKAYFAWFAKDRTKMGHPDEVKKWFEEAGRGYSDGASLANFIGKVHAAARSTLTPEETTALADVLAAYQPPGNKPKAPAKKRAFVKEWKVDDLLGALDEVGKNRTYDRGKEVFESAQCISCHKFGNDGGAVGAELTAASSKYTRRDILESILEPSKVISEQYQNTMILTMSGKILDGRVLEENTDRLILQPNPLQPEKIEVKKKDIEKRAPSKVSPMPQGLVNNFTKDEILDLLAYIESAGKKDHPAFAAMRRAADVTDRVAAEVKGNALKISASNDLFGDPAQNQPKRLKVDYLDGDEVKSKTVDENATLEIKASEGKKLTIKKAVYGVIP